LANFSIGLGIFKKETYSGHLMLPYILPRISGPYFHTIFIFSTETTGSCLTSVN
jgi:hypothetical protein